MATIDTFLFAALRGGGILRCLLTDTTGYNKLWHRQRFKNHSGYYCGFYFRCRNVWVELDLNGFNKFYGQYCTITEELMIRNVFSTCL